jgi:hypothetical protein
MLSKLHLEHSGGGEGSDGDGGAQVLPCARRSLRIAKDGAGGGELRVHGESNHLFVSRNAVRAASHLTEIWQIAGLV